VTEVAGKVTVVDGASAATGAPEEVAGTTTAGAAAGMVTAGTSILGRADFVRAAP
jgi:hypothetical protein